MARGLSSALAANVAPVSGTSGAPGNASSPVTWLSRIRASSRSLPSFLVARTRASADIEGFELELGQLGAALGSQVEELAEHVAAERLTLGGALDLHEVPGSGADHVHVGVRRHVLLVAQVKPRLAVADAHAHPGHRGQQRADLCPPALSQPGPGI